MDLPTRASAHLSIRDLLRRFGGDELAAATAATTKNRTPGN